MKRNNLRQPIAAGHFYPAVKALLQTQLATLIPRNSKKMDALACILPHAGYIFSGKIAGETIARINLPEDILLLGPNHTGKGAPYSIMTEGTWVTPLGDVPINTQLAEKISLHSQYLKNDTLAHLDEHSLEVEIPFLQFIRSDIKIVPVAFLAESFDTLKAVGKEIAAVIKGLPQEKRPLIIVSSDMTHYEPEPDARQKDKKAIDAICALDEDALMQAITHYHISMCGYAPTIVMLTLVKELGAKKTELVRYTTSAEATGDKTEVVGYAGILIS